MTWAPGRQRPSTWPATRRRILNRDNGTCYLCGAPGATEVDHRLALAAGGSDTDDNLAAVHTTCHRTKTAREANAIRWRTRATRPDERHPGMT